MQRGPGTLYGKIAEMERREITQALTATRGNVKAAARSLAINRTTLVEMMRRLGMQRDDYLLAPILTDDLQTDTQDARCPVCRLTRRLVAYIVRTPAGDTRVMICQLCSIGYAGFEDDPARLARALSLRTGRVVRALPHRTVREARLRIASS